MAETTTETSPPAEPTQPSGIAPEERAVARIEGLTHRAATLARNVAERVPAAVVVIAGGAVLIAADAFGVGEVVTAGIAGYAAYRVLLRRARAHNKAREEEQQTSASEPAAAQAE